ncbi:selenocysteine-specific translation elongation factor SelB [Modicisalibacter xianhensis]|uniref:Selenocysteine-specific elongation factor n=1 Tax=Modicisalibacter xianhensis TaxID=442341 RepID=A0A4R8FJ44_9GAMM|nr:selenocysteine-specific translation elongation factor [Halomonas xianhensis]TDX26180.1 selenocysteine-specific translation elongation factor SelB [Halomonas xianhensis]
MIVGTAGHVDHGKTALIQCLTGIDTDRLKEEKARGLTIEAGFAYPEVEPGMELGFVDVPGHEKFIHNMMAGSAGIDSVLLVVAADDGVMPQTVEHVQILSLLGLSRGRVALTKCDLVDAARLARVESEIRQLLSATPLAEASIYRVSSHTGEGVGVLRDALWTEAAQRHELSAWGAFRLAVDRVFTKTGAGLVVTGTAVSGTVHEGDMLRLEPSGIRARVRSLRRQHRESEQARQGDRVALNLVGSGVERDAIVRGGWVVDESLETPPLQRVDVDITLLGSVTALKHWTPVHVHLGVARLTGRVSLLEGQRLEPGGRMLGQLVLGRPVHACLGDRFVIRDHGGRMTLGGGTVLDGDPPRRGQRAPKRLSWLTALAECAAGGSPYDVERPIETGLSLWPEGLDLDRLARNFNSDRQDLAARVEALGGQVVSAQGHVWAFSRQGLESVKTRTLETLQHNHVNEPSMLGTERERLRRQVMPGLPGAFFRPLLNIMIDGGDIERHGPFLALPGHQVALDEADERLWQQVQPLLADAPFEPPRVRDITATQGLDEQAIRQALMACARLGRVYQVRKDHFYEAMAVEQLAGIIKALDAEHGAARAADFRDHIGTGRKLAIQILEFFDRLGFTRRIRDDHIVLRHDMFE